MDFLELAGKRILVFGVANRKSVAWQTGKVLEEAGAEVIYVVRSEARKESLGKLSPQAPIYVCDVEHQEQIDQLATEISQNYDVVHGLAHSIAFADYSAGWLPFHETPRAAFLQAVDISCFSLTALSNAFKDLLDPEQGSVVTI
ncbi:MAG: SDR family oxidoreductase, partial [Planctomycetaceae bacterium]|nr:SDR family oxidoreductase [Planctomycetaceae bacterium]